MQPSNRWPLISLQALEALLPAAAWQGVASLPEGRALAEALVNHHWVTGSALGAAALRARAAVGTEVGTADGSSLKLQLQPRWVTELQ